MLNNPKMRLEEIDSRLKELPKGTLTYKTINGKKQPYIQRTIQGKSQSVNVKLEGREKILLEFQERKSLEEEKKRLLKYYETLKDILKENPYLDAQVGCGYQDFRDFACGQQFYVDKTHFITQWLRSREKVTLITRPRRFGKTTLLSTVENFLDPACAGHPEYFEKLKVWKSEQSRKCYGTIPTVTVSFGSCKGMNYAQAVRGMISGLFNMYEIHNELLKSEILDAEDKEAYRSMREKLWHRENNNIEMAIPELCRLLYKHYGTKPVILLDEYDTPLLEAYTDGYCDEMIGTCRQMFHSAFKENNYYSRAIITGVTRVSKNSLFSDLNNIKVATVTCDEYSDCFGFTEQEVKDALMCQSVDQMQEVKKMYDGFIFGSHKDIYNPWSICNYLIDGELLSYWTNTSSNKLVGDIIRKHPMRSKHEIEQLMAGEVVHKEINENITFQYLDGDENSLWSLLLAVGYIKADNVKKKGEITECDVSVTNQEVMGMFRSQIREMVKNGDSVYRDFVYALMNHKTELLSEILTEVAYTSMSYFDTGKGPAERTPENFYHGLVLGLIVSLRDQYRIVSNRESGMGRYDIAMYPLQKDLDAFILEFKVMNEKKEKEIEDTARNALLQIEEKAYETDLLAAGIPREKIYKLGIAFAGKNALVMEQQ